MGFLGVFVSFLFFFNPNVNIIDIFPDFVGYIILVLSLRAVGDLNEEIDSALKLFRYMIFADMGKLLAILWLFGLSSYDERNTGTLLLGFIFSLTEVLLLCPAFSRLFHGLLTLGYTHENQAILGIASKKKQKSYTEKARSATLRFVILKSVMSVLPEFSNLTSYEYDETGTTFHSMYEFIGLLRGFAFVIVLIAGLLWLFRMMRYFERIRKDSVFLEKLREQYKEKVLPRKGLFILRGIRFSFLLFILGAVFLIDVRVDGFSMLPDAVGSAFFLVGFLCVRKYLAANRLPLLIAAVVHLILSVASYVGDIAFEANYSYSAVYRDLGAYRAYISLIALSLVRLLSMTFLLVLFVLMLFQVVECHTGFLSPTHSKTDEKRLHIYHKEEKKRLASIAVTGTLAVLGKLFALFFANTLSFATFVGTLTGIAFAVTLAVALNNLSESMDTKYMLEN